MFTGLVETTGVVLGVTPSAAGCRVEFRAGQDLDGLQVGESIAVDGACLTVVSHDGRRLFSVDVSPETLARTTLGDRPPGSRVNLERAMRLGDRVGGHLVSGHVDAPGTVMEVEPRGEVVAMHFASPPEVHRYLVAKGSITVDGVSLTVNQVDPGGSFRVMLIPHTLAETTLSDRRPGDRVNLEADLVGKYVERLLEPYTAARGAPPPPLDPTGLSGFITRR